MKTWNEECGVIGVWNHEEASKLVYLGLYAMQHRGQESTGIVMLNEEGLHVQHKGLGLVADVFKAEELDRLQGRCGVGHVRYSTTGLNQLANAQPLTAQLMGGPIAIAHNGNIVNSEDLRDQLKKQGAIFQGTNDTECLLHMLARHPSIDLARSLHDSLLSIRGAFSMVVLTKSRLIAARDPYGFRPLSLASKVNERGEVGYFVASESCAFDLLGAKYEREILPGEILVIDKNGIHSEQFIQTKSKQARCVFEHIYFSRPDSYVFGLSVYETRKEFGRMLARQSQIDADMVIPVPDSGVPSALGYSQESKIPFELGIIRNHYVGRTFIQPHQSIRSFGVKIKLNPQKRILAGKKVIVIDDSIVRGTTSRKIIRLIRQSGAKEVHLRISSPPTTGPCFYGVDTPRRTELIASEKSVEEIRKFVEADSLEFLSIESLSCALGSDANHYCSACFDGNYPV